MFTFQTMGGKRGRDDDSDSDFDEERYLKKARPVFNFHPNHGSDHYPSPSNLPYRPSLTPSPPRIFTSIGSMTPAQSERGGANSPDSIDDTPVLQSQEINHMDYDMDMDDDENDVRSQPPESPALGTMNTFMRPATLKPSAFHSDATGRVPTPIHPTFKRGGMNGLGYPMSGSAGAMSINNGQSNLMQAPQAWKGSRPELDDDRNRRMPSPISEDEDIPDTPTALTQSQLSRLSFSQQMDTETSSATLVLPPTPRGRKRSGALTGVGRFSMGYRDDCDKCRQRVPGHYSHFLP